MNVKISVFVICVEAIVYLLLYNLHDCTPLRCFLILKEPNQMNWFGSGERKSISRSNIQSIGQISISRLNIRTADRITIFRSNVRTADQIPVSRSNIQPARRINISRSN